MFDFLKIVERPTRAGTIEIKPLFKAITSKDLMIRGGDFYAIWVEERQMWSTSYQDAINLIDDELDRYFEENKDRFDRPAIVLHLWDTDTGMIDKWVHYCTYQMWDNYHDLDDSITFENTSVKREDYASKRVDYSLEEGSTQAWDELTNVLYSPEEKHKIEWAIGAIVTGDSKNIQKFLVFYGSHGTGKSTVLNVIQKLFKNYYCVFDAKALGSEKNAFALEPFRENPLVAIQHDGDLSKIEDNTRINSLVSHEVMPVNVKHKSIYTQKFRCFLFMGTNRPVRITDAKSGLIRRLIDVSPTGVTVPKTKYNKLYKQIDFELGAIAYKCRDIYLKDPYYYDNYIPISMLGASNDFYNFMLENYHVFKNDNGTTLKAAWEMYKTYVDEAKLSWNMNQRVFKEELKNYFWDFEDRFSLEDGSRVRSYYYNFRTDRFEDGSHIATKEIHNDKPEWPDWLNFTKQKSILDEYCQDCPAQEATKNGFPKAPWDEVQTTLKDIFTDKLHWVRIQDNHIVIDFDIPNENGEKCLEKNLEAASKWPETYAELSKSGKGIHLHYIYTGDVSRLSTVYDDHVEIKVYTGKSALRRKLSKCNGLPINTISSGLPLREERKKDVANYEVLKTEKELRNKIIKALRKDYPDMPSTKQNMNFIAWILDQAYEQGLSYDLTSLGSDIYLFACGSTNNDAYCRKLYSTLKLKSDDIPEKSTFENDKIVFFDCEVFPNFFLICWKFHGIPGVMRMFNPTAQEIEELIKFKLIGFNNRNYDNHILYARLIGYDNAQLYDLSRKLVNATNKHSEDNGKIPNALSISYSDIFDFASAANKKSLKKLEIEMGTPHKELGIPWDQPVPEEMWDKVAEYCENDVIATEAAFEYLNADWTARQILAEIAGGTVNDTTNSLTTKFIFGSNKYPQDQFNYRYLGDISVKIHSPILEVNGEIFGGDEFTVFDSKNRPIFPGYRFDWGHNVFDPIKEKELFKKYADKKVSYYRGEVVGEGGYVYAEPGVYTDVALLDIASMHPSSIIAENLFGDTYTQRFADIRNARIAIKHGDYETAKQMFDGKLAGYLTDKDAAKSLANALKTAINAVYGLTAAGFNNAFRDKRNIDNIVAKRGALFMVNLKHRVQELGFTVVHIKTDSIKIANATPEIIDFVMEYGKLYGYNFEHEATYERICLVNDAVYIARYLNEDGTPGDWTATGAEFAVPYIFKTLFSHEPIDFNDLCETKSVTSAIYLDMNENLPENEHNYIFVGKCGQFCPIKPGAGGGKLVRISENKKTKETKYDNLSGTKDYRWLESETVKTLHKEDDIDKSFYRELVDGARKDISVYMDPDLFCSEEAINVPWDLDEDNDDFKKR